MQNFVPALSRELPALRVPYDPDRPFGLVDLADVAEAAARVLGDERHRGATYELGGPRLVSVRDVAAAATEVLGRPVPVGRISPREWADGDGARLPERERDWLAAMFGYYDRHGLPAGSVPLRALLARDATPLPTTLARELR